MESLSSSSQDTWLPWFLRGILFLAGLIIIGRLFELQIVKGKYYRSLADGNRIKRVVIPAPRGNLLSRSGEVLSGDAAAPVIGYLGEVNEKEVGRIDPNCLEKGPKKMGAIMGKEGLEKEYNCILSGFDGEELSEVDTRGEQVRLLGRKEVIAGEDLKTNINWGLQKKAAELMVGKKGAVVISDGKGEIMALYSSPSYNPEQVETVLNSQDQPLFNRAISGLYHPGSIYKILVALAALEEGTIDEEYLYDDPGVLHLETNYGDFFYSNWYFSQYGKTEGQINIVKAIARSCDTFFYNLGELLGIDQIVGWSKKLKLDQITGIDIPGETAGFIPSPVWKEKTKGEKWFLGNTYHISIGQGDLALTPLLVNSLTSVIASGGYWCQARIVGQPDCQNLRFLKKNLDLIRQGLTAACSYGGTGAPFFALNEEGLSTGRQVACKTGTAETGKTDVTHAWFTAFTPVDYPEIVVTVLVEEGGEGSTVAGPIAKEIIDYWNLEKEP